MRGGGGGVWVFALHFSCKICIPVYSSLSQNEFERIELELHTAHAYIHFISVR